MTAEAVREEPGGEQLRTTWDGLPVAADLPNGAAVVVRRRSGDDFEYLLLHRAYRGPDYEGDWAWTPPSGARQPGEPLLTGALRELQEEAGLTGLDVHAIDLSGRWALYLAEVTEHAVALIDPEHDRYAWASAEEALRRCAPETVRENLHRTAGLPSVGIAFAGAGEGASTLLVDGAASGEFGHVPVGADGRRVLLRWTVGDAVRTAPRLVTRALWCYLRDVLVAREPGVLEVAVEPDRPEDALTAETVGFLPAAEPGGPLLLDVRRVFGG
ncbi:NUDIX domain-containing protein [Streptomyces sp. NPDC092296]|uniref:NUDIX domain-containing protein n=1 Tax=Streptomyces sp. NPDC092296 TaxID=3366012 RepID=UPI00381162E3